MKKYNPQKIEKKWQKKWYSSGIFRTKDSGKNKFYLLNEFPYPSGDGLHVGHCRPYIGLDVIARKKRMQGFNVLYPMGWDAFGLPTENYAIKMGVHPSVVTKKNTANFRRQMDSLGLSFDWSREINTTDPKYYKWTQWIFIKLFEKGLAYKAKMAINWCPKDKIGLANEEVIGGKCERCGTQVEKREKEQWLIKITKYADRLVKDLDLVDYPERVKIQQKEWIGRSEGAEIKFRIKNYESKINVFTTRPDTLFGCTFLVLAPEHPIINNLESRIKNYDEVKKYINKAKNKSDLQRQESKEKTGIELKGIKAINPATKKEIPIFVADYVMMGYGTGAIMAVPAHDLRDYQFAKRYSLEIKPVIAPNNPQWWNLYMIEVPTSMPKKSDPNYHTIISTLCQRLIENPYIQEGILVNSGKFDGMDSEKAKWEITKLVGGKKTLQYKLRDWVFSRQHYWGEPIPMIHCDSCGWQPVPEKDLPVELPNVKKYQPTDTGESPLAAMDKWLKVDCPECGGAAQRETDTMPNWAGSNWYFMRYIDPKNSKSLASSKNLNYWLPVDWYNGGMEHTTLHLLYSRFIFKFLWDIGAVPKSIGSEPYKKRTSHGVILGPGGVKMSKSKGNVINPDDVAKQYGADTLRVYEMFMGPFEQMIPWDEKGIIGCRRFLEKVYKLSLSVNIKSQNVKSKLKVQNDKLSSLLNKTIKKIGEDIELMKFNTAISALMEFSNVWSTSDSGLSKKNLQSFLAILSPFAPHLIEELWNITGFKGMCSQQKWPKYDEKIVKEEKVMIIMQINGKVRDKMPFSAGVKESVVKEWALSSAKVKPFIDGKKIKKVIFVKDKLINIVF